jgi:hypothetical protein
MTEPIEAPDSPRALVRIQYTRGVAIALVGIVGVWHLTNDLAATLGGLRQSRAPLVPVAAWLVFAGIAAWLCPRLVRTGRSPRYPWTLGAVLLLLAAAVDLASSDSQVLAQANWAWGAIGWLAIVVFWRRPLAGLLPLLGLNALATLARLTCEGGADRSDIARYMMIVVGTGSLQIGLAGTVHALRGAAGWVADAAAARARLVAAQAAGDEAHRVRVNRYRLLREGVADLLAELGYGTADPADPVVRRRCATEAARLRRLMVETDDVPDPLIHELRACADIAERNGVLVDLVTVGVCGDLPVQTRRALTEPPIAVLIAARSHARLTVTAARGEVAVSVLADAELDPDEVPTALAGAVQVGAQRDGDLLWVEARTPVS